MFNILCCTDEKYASYYGIMLTSLFEKNIGTVFDIYIITARLDEKTIIKYKLLASQNNSRIHIITINDDMMKRCPIREGDHVTLAAYYRIIAPLFLPELLDKILYFDGDIITGFAIVFINTHTFKCTIADLFDTGRDRDIF